MYLCTVCLQTEIVKKNKWHFKLNMNLDNCTKAIDWSELSKLIMFGWPSMLEHLFFLESKSLKGGEEKKLWLSNRTQ